MKVTVSGKVSKATSIGTHKVVAQPQRFGTLSRRFLDGPHNIAKVVDQDCLGLLEENSGPSSFGYLDHEESLLLVPGHADGRMLLGKSYGP